LLGDEGGAGVVGVVGPGGEEELAEEGVEGFADGGCCWGWFGGGGGGGGGGVVDADVELAAQGDEEPAEDEQGALFGVGLEGGGGEDGWALGPAVADFDDGAGGEEGRRAGYVGEVAFDGAEELGPC
jgi:hypothetical protein